MSNGDSNFGNTDCRAFIYRLRLDSSGRHIRLKNDKKRYEFKKLFSFSVCTKFILRAYINAQKKINIESIIHCFIV